MSAFRSGWQVYNHGQLTLYTHCCRMGTAINHPVPDRVKLSFVIFDTRAL